MKKVYHNTKYKHEKMRDLKIRILYILIFLTLFISACSNDIDPKDHIGEIFSVALDSVMEHNEELNSDMELIVINVSVFEELDESDKEEISNYFEKKYDVDLMVTDDTVQELKETELYNPDTSSLDGFFLAIDKIDFKDDNEIFFEGSKYCSDTNGFAIEFTVDYEGNEWQTNDIEELWRLVDPID